MFLFSLHEGRVATTRCNEQCNAHCRGSFIRAFLTVACIEKASRKLRSSRKAILTRHTHNETQLQLFLLLSFSPCRPLCQLFHVRLPICGYHCVGVVGEGYLFPVFLRVSYATLPINRCPLIEEPCRCTRVRTPFSVTRDGSA